MMSRRAALVVAAVVALLAAVGLGVGALVGGGRDGPLPAPSPSPSPSPSETPPPPVVLAASTPEPVDDSAPLVGDVLAPLAADARLGDRVGVAVVDLSAGTSAYGLEDGRGQMPASTLKVLTAVAALEAVGPQTRFSTRAVLTPDQRAVVLVGGGDPLLTADPDGSGVPEPTRLADLATATAEALQTVGAGAVRVVVDDRFFRGPAVDPDWEPRYLGAGVVSPVSALAVDGGRTSAGAVGRSPDPAIAAGQAFARLLAAAGVAVEGAVERSPVPRGSSPLAVVRSVPLESVVEYVLATSDNDAAEVLGRHTAFVTGRPASEAGASEAATAVLAGLGLDVTDVDLRDASGLARGSRVPPRLLAQALALASSPEHPRLRAAVTGLPVAGFTGTLDRRFEEGAGVAGAGEVRAKTGTLTGVGSLAGLITAESGTTYSFAVVADAVPPGGAVAAREALDAVAAALATCGCAAAG
jgi:D-alanyl-D-alanine carboxypeptidase/D-alanyl-D-alanine-endopeptidase (penicillin-binding protein 4)